MRKRLRKKKRIGEFKELAFPIAFRLNSSMDEEAVDAFITDLVAAVEARNLAFVGSGHHEWYGSLGCLSRGSATTEDQTFVNELLTADKRVEDVVIGPLRDAWHGDSESDPELPPVAAGRKTQK
jgi:uncharacterized protein YggL (DUF469 family)